MRPITVQIPLPCPERWDDMQPTQQGRFCASCQKTVVDYTALSDQELVRRLSRSSEVGCGRFRDDQLNRPLVPSTVGTAQAWRRWIGLLTMSLLGWQTAKAQLSQSSNSAHAASARSTSVQTDSSTIPGPSQKVTDSDKKWTIRGRVMSLDSSGNLVPVQGANVAIGRLADYQQTETDSAGLFELDIPSQLFVSEMTARAYAPDHIPKSISFNASPSITSYVLDDIIVRRLSRLKFASISGGVVCVIKSPSRWQRFKRSLFH
ncbi:hypothetical protein [Spirosoma radiotolerans]|uniref:hypothetical protein n=1 Tax=Spirosoma radiotolerans TaxID=1379870 RepID=UPI000697347E|nr:hypothetical protein [Spirosoma radiotolerans]